MGEALSKWQNDQPPPGNCQQAHTYYAQWSSTQHHEVPANSIHNLPATQGKLFRRPPPAHRNNNLLSYYRGELCDVQTQTNFSCPSTLLYRTSSSLSVSGNNNDAERSDKVIATRTEHHCLGQDEFESRWKPDSIVSENNLQTPTLPENLSNTTQNQCPQTSRHEPGTSSPNVYKYGQWPAYSPTVEQSRSENFSSSQYLSPLDLSLTSQLVEQQVVPHNEDDDSGDSHVDSADAGVFVNRASTWSSNRTIHELCHQDSPLVNFSVTQPPEWWAVRDARSHKVTHPIHRDGGPINYHHGDILLSRNHNLSSSSSQPVLPLTVVTASPLSLPPPLVVDDEEDDDDISAVYPIIHNGAIKKRRTSKLHVDTC